MRQLVLLILLLTIVYSWEECKYVAKVLWSKIRKQKINYEKNLESDSLVSDIVLIATIPLSLGFLLLGGQTLVIKLLLILAEFFILGLFLKGIEEYNKRRYATRHYEGFDQFIAIGFSLLGFASPAFRYAGNITRSTSHVGKYLLTLAAPLAIGLALVIAIHNLGMEEFKAKIDLLIIIVILAMVLNITIGILERMFKFYRFNMTQLIRIMLGVVILFTITMF